MLEAPNSSPLLMDAYLADGLFGTATWVQSGGESAGGGGGSFEEFFAQWNGDASTYGQWPGVQTMFDTTYSSSFDSSSIGGLLGGIAGGLINGSGGSQPDVKEVLTSIANQAEAALQANLGAYNAQQISQAGALSRGWQLMNDFVTACYRYGSQGQLSAAERDRRINPTMLKWDWIAYYIDPIAGGLSQAQPLPAAVTSSGGGGVTGNLAGFGDGASQAGLGLAGIPDWALVGIVILGLLWLSKK